MNSVIVSFGVIVSFCFFVFIAKGTFGIYVAVIPKDKKAFFKFPRSILIVMVVHRKPFYLSFEQGAPDSNPFHAPSHASMPGKSWTKKLGCDPTTELSS